jgi:hypothetical protein
MKAATDHARTNGHVRLPAAARAAFLTRSCALVASALAATPPPIPGQTAHAEWGNAAG